MPKTELIIAAASVVAAYVSRNEMSEDQVPEFLAKVATKLISLENGSSVTPPIPPVPIEESYTDDYIVCLEDGKKVTLLKRHLAKHFEMTPEEYFEKWGLPEDYPLVTRSYSEKRSKIAKAQGLGRT